jgi:glyceraldehyde 3-phosphate dehydrogenase
MNLTRFMDALSAQVTHGDDWMDVGSGKIHMSRERDPANIPHAAHGVDIVLECSGKFNSREASPRILPLAQKKCLCPHHAKTPTRPLFLASMTAC